MAEQIKDSKYISDEVEEPDKKSPEPDEETEEKREDVEGVDYTIEKDEEGKAYLNILKK